MSIETWTLLIAIVTAIACGLCGSLLVVGRQAMVSEGLSHAVLPGLVVAFLFFRSFDSPWLIASAALSGLIMVWVTRALSDTRLVDSDAGLGLVFAAMFSTGILLVSLNLKNAHFHADCIIDGNLALAPLNRADFPVLGRVPRSMITMTATFLVIATFVLLAYKELKIMIFDPTHAARVGFRPVLLGYVWITIVSLTTVTAFDVAGSVLIVALMIAPPASAYLLTRRFSVYLVLSMAIAAVSAVLGFYLAKRLDVSPTGPVAAVAGGLFLLVFVFNPTNSLLATRLVRHRRRKELIRCLCCELMIGCADELEALTAVSDRLRIGPRIAQDLVRELQSRDWIQLSEKSGRFEMTVAGQEAVAQAVNCPA
ncbi:MAG: metal ABC transporter permease [Planctomycetota bacterium]